MKIILYVYVGSVIGEDIIQKVSYRTNWISIEIRQIKKEIDMKIINLSPETQDYISTITAQMEKIGFLEDADKKNIELLGTQYELYVRAMKELEQTGLTVTDRQNRTVVNPAFNVQRSAMVNIVSLIRELSLSARQRRLLSTAGQVDEDDPMDIFLDKMNSGIDD